MKIRRGPRSTSITTKTDQKPALTYAKKWRPGKSMWFDGTIDKSGKRHTDLGVEIEESDIVALSDGLLRHYKSELNDCEKSRNELRADVERLETAMRKIASLAVIHRDRAPSTDELLIIICNIANHYHWTRKEPFSTTAKWLKWNSL